MNLCCEINPTKECKTCRTKFCEDHVYTKDKSYFGVGLPSSECFSCYNERERRPLVNMPRRGMTAKELYQEVRNTCPTGYMTISLQISDPRPGHSSYSTEWSIYHETYKNFKGATPEQVLGSFKAHIQNLDDPQVSPLANADF